LPLGAARRKTWIMRAWRLLLWVAALAVVLSGCGQGLTRDDGQDAGSVCDGKGSCNECLDCAAANPCRTLVQQCQQNSACTGLEQCLDICGGLVDCENDCRNNNPNGITLYNAKLDCLYCQQCPGDCAGFRTCE
jgi:hypothetical protein